MTRNRNFSMNNFWMTRYGEWAPELTFSGNGTDDWSAWRDKSIKVLGAIMGSPPSIIDPHPEIEYSIRDDGLMRERVVFDVELGLSIPCLVLYRDQLPRSHGMAAVICCHGHGGTKESVAGIRSSDAAVRIIDEYNYDYGLRLANAGFFVLCPDLRGFGERSDPQNHYQGRDICDINFLKGCIGGIYPLAQNVWDIQRCVDYLKTREEIDGSRIGIMGLSLGGTVALFAAAIDDRIRASDISGFVNPLYRYGIRDANFCGSQIVPQLYRYFDIPDIAGLIAPRPLMLEMGIYDSCFPVQDQLVGFTKVEDIYRIANATKALHRNLHSRGHASAGDSCIAFFEEFLKA